MRRFVEQADRGQWTLLPECLDDFIDDSNPVRVIDVFVDALDLAEMSFEGVEPAATGRPSYHPSVLLKLYISFCRLGSLRVIFEGFGKGCRLVDVRSGA
jgi:transposase